MIHALGRTARRVFGRSLIDSQDYRLFPTLSQDDLHHRPRAEGQPVHIADISVSNASLQPIIHRHLRSTQLFAIMIGPASTLFAITSLFLPTWAQPSSCSSTLMPTNSVQPSVASGYRAQLIATGLSTPRSIKFDKAGNLLVVEQKNGNGSVSALTLLDNGGTCLSVVSHTTLVTQSVGTPIPVAHISAVPGVGSNGTAASPSDTTSDGC